MNNLNYLEYKRILTFRLPLLGTWLMMSVEGPFLSAIIARLPDPTYNLAAYGVAFSFALIAEAPIIMIMSAATALVEDKLSFIKLKNYTNAMNIGITLLMLICLIPPVFNFMAIDLMNLPENVAELTHTALIILLPWPGAIGYRRFFQGVLIKYNFTRRVAYGTFVRLISMSLTALILYFNFSLAGVFVGAISLSAGVICEAIAVRIMSAEAIKAAKSDEGTSSTGKELSYKDITQFYYPLALTSIISLGVHPIVIFFMGMSINSLESLAALPVINALVFIFRSIGLSYQEVGIVLMGDNLERYKPLRNFAMVIGTCVGLLLVIVAFTPLSDIWFIYVSGLTPSLAEFSKLPLQIISVIPFLSFWLSFQRAVFVYSRKTKPITLATILEVTSIIIILFISIKIFALAGAVSAVLALLLGRLMANLFLVKPFREVINSRYKNYETA